MRTAAAPTGSRVRPGAALLLGLALAGAPGDAGLRAAGQEAPREALPAPSPATPAFVPRPLALTAEERAFLAAHPEIRVGVDPAYRPFGFVSSGGRYGGLTADYVRIAEGALGIRFTVVPIEGRDLAHAARAQRLDVLAGFAPSPRSAERYTFTTPFLAFPLAIVTRYDAPFVQDLADVADRPIAVLPLRATSEVLAGRLPNAIFVLADSPRAQLELVARKRAFSAVANLAAVNDVLDGPLRAELKVAAVLGSDPDVLAFAVRKDWPVLSGLLQRVVDAVPPEEAHAIRARWLSVRVEERRTDWGKVLLAAAPVVGAFVAVLAVMALANRRLKAQIEARERLEAEVRRSEASARAVFEHAGVGIAASDLDGRILRVNDTFCDLLGSPAAEVVGRPLSDFVHPEDRAASLRSVGEAVEGEGVVARQHRRFLRKGGEVRWGDTRVSTVRGPDGRASAVVTCVSDVTVLKEAQAALADQLLFQQALVDTLPNPIFFKDAEARFVGCNRAYEAAFGTSRHALAGKTVLELAYLPEEARRAYHAEDVSVIAQGTTVGREETLTFADGVAHECLYWVAGFRQADGRPGGLVGVVVDITDQKQAEREARKAQELLRDVTDGVPGVVLQLRRDAAGARDVTFVSRQVEELLGVPGEAARAGIGALLAVVHEEDRDAVLSSLDASAETLEPWAREFRVTGRDGEARWFLGEAEPRPLADGGVVWNGLLTDVTERRRLREGIRAAEQRWQLALAANADGIWDWNVETGAVWYSPRWKAILGYADAEVANEFSTLARLLHPEDLQGVMAKARAFTDGKLPRWELEYRMRHKDGSWRWIASRAAGQKDASGRIVRVVGSHRDMTARRQADIELKTLSEAIRQNPAMVFITRPTGEITYVNPQFTRVTGYAFEDVQGRKPSVLKSGWVDDSVYADLWATVLRGDLWRGEMLNKKKDGDLYWASVSISSVKDEKGGVSSLICIQEDITDRKQAEKELASSRDSLEARSEELTEAVKILTQTQDELSAAMAAAEEASRAKSEFLANMSHEIRTPMNAIIGLSHLALQTPLTPKQREYVSRVYRSAQSLLGIINDILDVSKIEAGRLTLEAVPFSLEEVLDNLATVVAARAAEKSLEVVVSAAPDVPRSLVGDPLRLGQVLLNLAGNAVKFTEAGEVTVRVSLDERSDEGVVLRFDVRDSGIGLTPEQIGKLFQPFSQADSSTTRKYGGTGLGLTISKRLVELMGGDIGVTSAPGEGSLFSFTARFGVGADEGTRERLVPPDLRGLRVLVVDDKESARLVAQDLLEGLGFRPATAGGGEEALEAARAASAEGDPFRAVLMDYRMEPLDGLEATRRLLADAAVRPSPAVVMMTAHGREEVMRQAEAAGVRGFLVKPVNPSVLLDALAEALLGAEGVAPLRASAAAERKVASLRGARLLVVDDNEINRQVAQEILEAAGATVRLASNGRVALAEIDRDRPDLVLMDVQMPEMDGLEATRLLRGDPRLAGLPILAMTAHALVEERQRCLAAGMDDHVSKPIDPDLLIDTVERHLARAGFEPGEEAVSRPVRPTTVEEPGSAADLPAGLPGFDEAQALRRVAGNRALLGRLLGDFGRLARAEAPALRAELRGADLVAARGRAHALKGVAGNLALVPVREAAARLEAALRSGDAAEAEALADRLDEELAPVLAGLDAWSAAAAAAAAAPSGEPADPKALEPRLRELDRLLAEGNLRADETWAEIVAAAGGLAADERQSVQDGIDALDYDGARSGLAAFARAIGLPWQDPGA